MARISRREFLQALGLGALASGWEFSGRAEAAGEVVAAGTFLVPGPNGEAVGQTIEIVGVKGYKYLATAADGKTVEVPIESVRLMEGWPFPYVVKEGLGFRNDAPWLMSWLPRLGTTQVRIWGPFETIGQGSDFDRAVAAARAWGFRPMTVFNPTRLVGEDHLRAMVRTLVDLHPEVIELGNEPDNTVWDFWEGQDLTTFAQFVRISIQEARGKGFGGPIVIGALVDVYKNPRLFNALIAEGVDLNSVGHAVHAYQSVWSVDSRMVAMRKYLDERGAKGAPIYVTELGVNYKDKHLLMAMVEAAWKKGAAGVMIHELPEWESPDGNWGLVDPQKEHATKMIFDFAAWTRGELAAGGYVPTLPPSTARPTVRPAATTTRPAATPTPRVPKGER